MRHLLYQKYFNAPQLSALLGYKRHKLDEINLPAGVQPWPQNRDRPTRSAWQRKGQKKNRRRLNKLTYLAVLSQRHRSENWFHCQFAELIKFAAPAFAGQKCGYVRQRTFSRWFRAVSTRLVCRFRFKMLVQNCVRTISKTCRRENTCRHVSLIVSFRFQNVTHDWTSVTHVFLLKLRFQFVYIRNDDTPMFTKDRRAKMIFYYHNLKLRLRSLFSNEKVNERKSKKKFFVHKKDAFLQSWLKSRKILISDLAGRDVKWSY